MSDPDTTRALVTGLSILFWTAVAVFCIQAWVRAALESDMRTLTSEVTVACSADTATISDPAGEWSRTTDLHDVIGGDGPRRCERLFGAEVPQQEHYRITVDGASAVITGSAYHDPYPIVLSR